jgi:hypothetical protein
MTGKVNKIRLLLLVEAALTVLVQDSNNKESVANNWNT